MDTKTIEYLANLGNLKFSSEETEAIAKDMTDIIAIMDTVKEIDITYEPLKDNKDVFLGALREDIKYDSRERDAITANAKSTNGFFTVPKVIE